MEKVSDRKNISGLLSNSSFQPILIGVVIIGAFFIGSLWTKVQILEKGVSGGSPTAANAPANAPAAPAPQAAAVAPKLDKDDHIRGDKKARIALIEYSDLECPFCKTFHPTAQKIVDDYKGKVMWVYRHFPLSFHANAQKEAEASECVSSLGGEDAFWKYIPMLLRLEYHKANSRNVLTPENLLKKSKIR